MTNLHKVFFLKFTITCKPLKLSTDFQNNRLIEYTCFVLCRARQCCIPPYRDLDVTVAGEWLQNLSLYLALMAFEQ